MQQWARPTPGLSARLLQPLSWLYRGLQAASRRQRQAQATRCAQPAVPVVVVGNLVAGGAGKTPTTIAVVQALQRAGWRPGVVSRGYGRQDTALRFVTPEASAGEVGDEPLLIHRRTGVPVCVAADRVAASHALLARHPSVNLLVADDALQHRQLRRDVEVIVFDERGAGNGLLLPAGPLREPMPPTPPPQALVLYNHAHATTAWPGACARRHCPGAWSLEAWLQGNTGSPRPLHRLLLDQPDLPDHPDGPSSPSSPDSPNTPGDPDLQGPGDPRLPTPSPPPMLAVAGIAVPERFFALLRQAGLAIVPAPQPDHQAYDDSPPWPAGTPVVVTTEKDAVKLGRWARGETAVWVVGLDLLLPEDFVAALTARLGAPPAAPATEPAPKDKT